MAANVFVADILTVEVNRSLSLMSVFVLLEITSIAQCKKRNVIKMTFLDTCCVQWNLNLPH